MVADFSRICRHLSQESIQTQYTFALLGIGVPGEYRPAAYRKIVAALASTTPTPKIFLDIGCGTGKAVFAAAMLGPFRLAVGIEVGCGLAALATSVASKEQITNAKFYEADATMAGLVGEAALATHVYIQSLGMPPATLEGLAAVLGAAGLPWEVLLSSHTAAEWEAFGLPVRLTHLATLTGLSAFGSGEQRRLHLALRSGR